MLSTSRPIQTYSGRGCIDQFGKQFFGTIYSSTKAPEPMDGEEGMTKVPIHLNPAHPADSLHESSRINYGKLYRVDHNLRVKDLGIVDVDFVHTLVRYFEESSVKLSGDLKFDAKNQAPMNDGTKETELAADIFDSILPKITIHEPDEEIMILQPLIGRHDYADDSNIAEAHEDEQLEPLFEFEP